MPTDFTIGGYQPIGSLLSQTLQMVEATLANHVGEEINIALINNIMDSGKVPGHMPELINSGEITMGYIASSYLADLAPELYVFDLPFEIKSRERAYKLVDGPF